MLLVFDALSRNPLSESQLFAADKVLESLNEMSAMECPETYSVVSSANKGVAIPYKCSGRLFTNNDKSRGTRTEPWGTLEVTAASSDCSWPIAVHWLLSVR